MKFRIFILFFLLQCIVGNSQELLPPPISTDHGSVETYYTDSLLLEKPTTDNSTYPKNFDEKFQSKYKSSEYDYTTVKPRESLWQKIQKRIREILESIFGKVNPDKTENYTENIIRIFAVIIIGFVLYFLIKFLLGKDGKFFFSKKKSINSIENQDLKENIHEINFSETIQKFENQKEYRLAIRFQFLSVLKKLADKKLINWNPEKTNKDYFSELNTTDLKTGFNELSDIFDYVWYGEFEVNEENYHHFKQKFLNFKI